MGAAFSPLRYALRGTLQQINGQITLRLETLEQRYLLTNVSGYPEFLERVFLARVATPVSTPQRTSVSSAGLITSAPVATGAAAVAPDTLPRLVRYSMQPLQGGGLLTSGNMRQRPVQAMGLGDVPPALPATTYAPPPTIARIEGPGTALYNGNTPTGSPLTAPVLPGQTRQVTLTIGAPTANQLNRLGVNVGDMNAFSQGSAVNNLITQSGTFELSDSRMLVHASDTAQSYTRVIVDDAWLWSHLGYASAIGATLVGSTGANAHGSWTIANMGPELDASGKATGRAIIWIQGQFAYVPAKADSFFVDMHNLATADLANYVYRTGNAQIARDNTVAHSGASSARIDLGAAGTSGNSVQLQDWFGADNTAGRNVFQPGHTYQLQFWAKAAGAGSATARLSLYQGGNWGATTYNLTADGVWHPYTLNVSANAPVQYQNGTAEIIVKGTNQTVYLDDLKVIDTTDIIAPGDPLSKQVVTLLQDYGFGELRFWHGALRYASFDDLIGPREARKSIALTFDTYDPQLGIPEMLQLAKDVGANPWIVVSPTWTKTDINHLMEYLGGDETTPYGAKRAADGHPGSWFADLGRIDIECNNESWNGIFAPFAYIPFEPYFARANEMFGDIKANPYYAANPGKMSLIVNGWQWVPWYTEQAVKLTPNADAVSVSSYTSGTTTGTMRDVYGSVLSQQLQDNKWEYPATIFGKQVYVYEENAGQLENKLSATQESEYATSLAAGLAVARQSMTLQRDYGITNQNLFQFVQRGLGANGGFELGHYGIFADLTTAAANPRPVALAAKLMNQAAGTILASQLTSGWMVDSAATTGTAATTSASDALVTTTGDQFIVTLFNSTVDDLTNTTFHFRVPTTLHGKAVAADWTRATFQLLGGPSISSNNETSKTVDITAGTFTHGLRDVYASLPGHSMGTLMIPLLKY